MVISADVWEEILQLSEDDPDEIEQTPLEILTLGEFQELQEPLTYLVDGVLLQGYLYSVTANTGGGKTAVALLLSYCVAENVAFGGRRILRPGRVLYLCGENATDVQIRITAMAEHYGFDPNYVEMDVIRVPFDITARIDDIQSRAEGDGYEYALVVVDTSVAYFTGDSENDNKQMQVHAAKQRELCELPGRPTVLSLCHPIKRASRSDLLPRGGGAFLAEVDGNLTLYSEDQETFEMGWLGKFRGPDFGRLDFGLTIVRAAANKTAAGDDIPAPVAYSLSAEQAEKKSEAAMGDQDRLLKTMLDYDGASLRDLAKLLGWAYPSGDPAAKKVERMMPALRQHGLVKQDRKHRWILTPAGQNEAESL